MRFFRPQAASNHHKMDRLFYNSVLRVKKSYNTKVGCHIGKAILLIAILILSKTVLQSSKPKLMGLAYLGLAVSIINAFINFAFLAIKYRDN